jgi:hypothetical protein
MWYIIVLPDIKSRCLQKYSASFRNIILASKNKSMGLNTSNKPFASTQLHSVSLLQVSCVNNTAIRTTFSGYIDLGMVIQIITHRNYGHLIIIIITELQSFKYNLKQ